MLTTERLIKKGYFPQEVVPCLTTEHLGKHLAKLILVIKAGYPKKGSVVRPSSSKCEHFTVPKSKNYRRLISIPNPFHQILLAETITDNWVNIESFTNTSNLSLSPLHLSDPVHGTRCFTKIDFHDNKRKLSLINGARYVLKFDITRFYASIYTHSIPWALHTKAKAKIDRMRSPLFGNAIDADLRNTQDGQTNGIPIGPDTSRVIGEVIATAIDVLLSSKIKNIKGVRIVDDFFLYFQNYRQVEEATAIIHQCLADYHLEHNNAKFEILELPIPMTNKWAGFLGKFEFRGTPKQQETDVFYYFNLAFELAKEYPEDYVISYAIARFLSIYVNKIVWPVLESFLLHTLFLESKVIRNISRIALAYKEAGYAIDYEKWYSFINNFIVANHDRGQPYEISWACWLAKQLSIKLTRQSVNVINLSSNSAVALTALDLRSSKLLESKLDTTYWRTLCTIDNLYSENWLLIYESAKKGWIKQSKSFFDSDPFFKAMYDNNVYFYDEAKVLVGKKVIISSPPQVEEYF